MTTARTGAEAAEREEMAVWSAETGEYWLPDPPEREPDEMTNIQFVHRPGNSHHLAMHFGNPETTLVESERWIVPDPGSNKARARRPDLMIAFGVSAEKYRAQNGYIISEQGKPPDFVLEVASPSTAETDIGKKAEDYALLGIREYWRFDSTGENYGEKLAGDRWEKGRYEAIPVEEGELGALQGYSAALDLYLRWEEGRLHWHDPATGRHILRYEDQRDRADWEQQGRIAAENRARELEAEVRRLRGG